MLKLPYKKGSKVKYQAIFKKIDGSTRACSLEKKRQLLYELSEQKVFRDLYNKNI